MIRELVFLYVKHDPEGFLREFRHLDRNYFMRINELSLTFSPTIDVRDVHLAQRKQIELLVGKM